MSAHPTSALIGYTFDTESGKQLALEDILETGDGSSAAEKEIREKFAAALTAGFLDYEYSGDLLQWGRRSAEEIVTGSFLELEESWRERHWYLSPEGFHMLFDVYQIGPYAAGNINVTVPWEKLSGIIKSEYMPDNLERLAAQGAPELLSYSNLGDKNKYDAEEHIYGDLSRSFWVGFTDAAAYEVKMECGNRMVFYANRMTPHDAVCLNDAEPETASPLDGGTVTYLWRQEGAPLDDYFDGYTLEKELYTDITFTVDLYFRSSDSNKEQNETMIQKLKESVPYMIYTGLDGETVKTSLSWE